MSTGSMVAAPVRCVLDLGGVGRRAAQAATMLTIGGAVSLGVFFAVGQPWGTVNDWTSIFLAAATVPIALGLVRRNPGTVPLLAGAGFDLVGVVISTGFTSLLISGRMTFEDSLSGVVAGQALMGCWLLLVGLAAWSDPGSRRLATLAITGGAGLVAVAAGIETGGMESPVAALGFIAAIIGTVGFYALLGRRPVG